MALPEKYSWLLKESGPIMVKEALKLFGISETLGHKSDPTILSWAKEIGGDIADIYKADEIPWCGLFIAVVAQRSSKKLVKDPLWALNWGAFGNNSDTPKLGDVLVFVRKTNDGKRAGHVGLYVGEDEECYHVLGGNQSDRVSITRIKRERLYASRRPKYNNQPSNVRIVTLSNSGDISDNEQ